ncbi:MAG: hypothetical protein PF484_02090 [Bacteroidales bacterium]|jgi:hypothetical protein|nr:hypothetical protein [Bacteroidales bacterium]
MKNITEDKIVENQAMDNLPVEIEPVLDGQNLDKHVALEHIEKDLNSKILKVTMTIKDRFPELVGFLEEMPETVPDEKDPEITLKNLNAYYKSLNSMLSKYKLEHPKSSK